MTTTVVSAFISALAAYGFSRIRFKGSGYVFLVVLATYMVPGQAILIPQFILYRQIGLFDSHLGLILLGSFSVLGTFMLRQFFMGIHQEFIESASDRPEDGAGQEAVGSNAAYGSRDLRPSHLRQSKLLHQDVQGARGRDAGRVPRLTAACARQPSTRVAGTNLLREGLTCSVKT